MSVTPPADVTALAALSRERDMWHDLMLAAWRDGFMAGVLAVKAVQHDVITDLRQHLRTWDGFREDFARPRAEDFPGRGEAA
jgi:hypothetical protein